MPTPGCEIGTGIDNSKSTYGMSCLELFKFIMYNKHKENDWTSFTFFRQCQLTSEKFVKTLTSMLWTLSITLEKWTWLWTFWFHYGDFGAHDCLIEEDRIKKKINEKKIWKLEMCLTSQRSKSYPEGWIIF